MNDIEFAHVLGLASDAASVALEWGYVIDVSVPSIVTLRSADAGGRFVLALAADANDVRLEVGDRPVALHDGACLVVHSATGTVEIRDVPERPGLRYVELRMREGSARLKLGRPTGRYRTSYDVQLDVDILGFDPIEEARFKLGADAPWRELEICSQTLEVDDGFEVDIAMGACPELRLRLLYLD